MRKFYEKFTRGGGHGGGGHGGYRGGGGVTSYGHGIGGGISSYGGSWWWPLFYGGLPSANPCYIDKYGIRICDIPSPE